MKKHLLFLCCLVMAALTLPSCSSDDGEGGTVIPPGGQGGQGGTGSTSYESLIIGEWGQVLLEYKYFNDITKTSDGHLKGNAAYWTFGHDSYFKHVNSEVPGTYSLQGDKLTTNWTAGGSTDFTILKLDKDSLVVKLLRSPHANAFITSIDKTAAMKVPGTPTFLPENGRKQGKNATCRMAMNLHIQTRTRNPSGC